MIWRVAYKRRGWKLHKAKTFGTEAAADRFIAKLRTSDVWTYRGDTRVLQPLVRLTKEEGTVIWEAEIDERSDDGQTEANDVRIAALDRFYSRFGHNFGEDPDDIYDLRTIEQEIHDGNAE